MPEGSSLVPPLAPRQEHCTSLPHPISEKELVNFFRACDHLDSREKSIRARGKAMVFPVFFRLLYSSGMRAKEARMLLAADVDLHNGIINVRHSKGNGQYYIVLHDTMLSLVCRYDDVIRTLYPERKYFFQQAAMPILIKESSVNISAGSGMQKTAPMQSFMTCTIIMR